MADGFLGGLGDFAGGVGDFFTGGGKYADVKNINPTYGVPEADVRQAGINTLGNISALLLAAGQPMEGSQRAQLLAQLGPAIGGMNTDIYKSSQSRLMNAQQQAARQEMEELSAIDQRRKSDPLGLAKEMNLPEGIIKVSSAKDLRDIAKQITIKRATVEPAQAALSAAFAQQAEAGAAAPAPVPAPAGEAVTTPAPAAPVAGSSMYSSAAIPPGTSPQDSQTIRAYQSALNNPVVARDPKLVKDITETLDRLMPGVREASIQRAKRQDEMVAGKPKALAQVEASEEQGRIADGLINSALKNLKANKEEPFYYPGVAGIVGGRLVGVNQQATDLSTDLDAIKSIIGSEKIKEMKAQSQTGATGYGSLAVRELDRIEATLGSLDQLQDPDKLAERLNTIKQSFSNYQKNTKLAYKEMYGEEYKPRQPSATPAVSGVDKQALDWANSNPNDPRSAAIKQRLGVR